MKRTTLALAAGALAMLTASQALADQFLGSYVARIGRADHFASDGYPLDTAAQMVRQDRANVHKFGKVDPGDESDPWFGSTASRARLENAQQEQRHERWDAVGDRQRPAAGRGRGVPQQRAGHRHRQLTRAAILRIRSGASGWCSCAWLRPEGGFRLRAACAEARLG
jgi:hypothetical protein